MSNNRIYTVTHGETSRLVRASNSAQAVRHVASDTMQCRVATQEDCVRLAAQGVQVEDVKNTTICHEG